MSLLKITLGFLLLAVAWAIIFRKKLVFQINAWMRDRIFSDQLVLFSGRRVAILLIILGGLALFSGMEGVIRIRPIKPEMAAQIIEQARADLKNKQFEKALRKGRIIVKHAPESIDGWEIVTLAWNGLDDKKQAQQAATVLVRLSPDHPVGRRVLQSKPESNKRTK